MLLCFREDEFKSQDAFLTKPANHRAEQLLKILSETHQASMYIVSRCSPTHRVF